MARRPTRRYSSSSSRRTSSRYTTRRTSNRRYSARRTSGRARNSGRELRIVVQTVGNGDSPLTSPQVLAARSARTSL